MLKRTFQQVVSLKHTTTLDGSIFIYMTRTIEHNAHILQKPELLLHDNIEWCDWRDGEQRPRMSCIWFRTIYIVNWLKLCEMNDEDDDDNDMKEDLIKLYVKKQSIGRTEESFRFE